MPSACPNWAIYARAFLTSAPRATEPPANALESGRDTEANPVMRSIVNSPPAFIAVKVAATAGVILAGERMWKKNRVAAVIFVAAANGAVAAIVARNYSVR